MNIAQLEIKRLIKELLYWREEHDLKEQIFNIIESKHNHTIDNNIDINLFEVLAICDNKPIENIKTLPIDNNTKKIYRLIAKNTHPDKNSDKIDFYQKSTEYYNNNDINNLLIMCEQLNLEYDYLLVNKEIIFKEIKSLKSKCLFYENSKFWKDFYNL